MSGVISKEYQKDSDSIEKDRNKQDTRKKNKTYK